MSRLFKINLDAAGILASIICALHCIAVPIVLSLGLVHTNGLLHNHNFDIAIIVFGIAVGSFSLIKDVKIHKSYFPLSLLTIGFVILVMGLRLGHDWPHVVMSVIGSSLVASAHFTNWRRVRNK